MPQARPIAQNRPGQLCFRANTAIIASTMFYYTPYIALPLLSVCVSAGLALFSLFRRDVPAARPFFWLMTSMAGWALSYSLNTAAIHLPIKVFFLKTGITFICIVVPSMLALALETVGLGAWLSRRRLILLSAIPLVSALFVWTSSFHSLHIYDFALVDTRSLLLLTYETGPAFAVHALYARLVTLAAALVFASGFWRMPRSEWFRYLLLVLATVTPLLVNILSPKIGTSFNFSTSTLFLSSICYAQAVFWHRMLDLMPLARAALFDQIGKPVLVFSGTGQLVDCNLAARRMLTGDGGAKLPAIRQAIQARFPTLPPVMANGRPLPVDEASTDTAEPERFWRITASPLEAGAIHGTLVLLHDISDLKRTEQRLLESQQRLEELNLTLRERIEKETSQRLTHERLLANQSRLAAMGEMIGVIAHQWRQPLATLGMIVQRAHAVGTMGNLTRPDLDEFKTSAMGQIMYMSDTIEEFRGFYRPDKERQLFCPVDCIHDCVRLFAPQFAGSNITIECRCPHRHIRSRDAAPMPPGTGSSVAILDHDCAGGYVYGLPNEFKQVVLNLLCNARDAILSRRSAGSGPDEGLIRIAIYVGEQGGLVMDFSDNGCGIPAADAPHIFDPCFTTKEESGGTGIGLFMSRMIVEDSLGGRLRLMPSDDGALFRIELPRKELP
jgi:signal transduction histidine kinase